MSRMAPNRPPLILHLSADAASSASLPASSSASVVVAAPAGLRGAVAEIQAVLAENQVSC